MWRKRLKVTAKKMFVSRVWVSPLVTVGRLINIELLVIRGLSEVGPVMFDVRWRS